MKYGYIRVSSNTQDETRQVEALRREGIPQENIYIDIASGKNFIGRDKWEKLLAKVIIGDIILIKELDRLGRNNSEIKETYNLMLKKGIELEFLDQPILNTTNKSRIEKELLAPLILHLLGYFAEKERKKILKRQKEAYNNLEVDKKGRKISRKKNKIVGRPNKIESLSEEKKKILDLWINKEIKTKESMQYLNMSESSLRRAAILRKQEREK